MRKIWLIAVIGCLVACKKEGDQKAAPAPVQPAPSAPVTDVTPAGGGNKVELPALDLKPVAAKRTREARKLNIAGLALHKAKDYPKAIEKFSSAVAADPGYVIARYNLACAYNLSGDSTRGLGLLKEIKDAGCPACVGRMVRARKDSDWESQWSSADFKALTDGVEAETGSVPTLAGQLESAFRSGKLQTIAAMIDARRAIKFEHVGGGCDATEPGCNTSKMVTGPAGLAGALKGMESTQAPLKGVACAKGCCSFDYSDDQPDLFMMSETITQACFSTDSGGVTTLSSIALMNGGI